MLAAALFLKTTLAKFSVLSDREMKYVQPALLISRHWGEDARPQGGREDIRLLDFNFG